MLAYLQKKSQLSYIDVHLGLKFILQNMKVTPKYIRWRVGLDSILLEQNEFKYIIVSLI